MSKSKTRVIAALEEAGLPVDVRDVGEARTALEAATSLGVELDQIAKSIIFRTMDDRAVLFLTAGGRRVDPDRAEALAGCALGKADAAFTRARTGFAIGGVAPLGHLTKMDCWLDRRLLDFAEVYGAAGTPRHVFPIRPADLLLVSGAEVADFAS